MQSFAQVKTPKSVSRHLPALFVLQPLELLLLKELIPVSPFPHARTFTDVPQCALVTTEESYP